MKLNGKSSDSYKKTLIQRYEGIARRTQQLNQDDVHHQIIMNSYTTSIDPHTAYFSPFGRKFQNTNEPLFGRNRSGASK